MTDVVDRGSDAITEGHASQRAEARRVLVIVSLFMLLAMVANVWF